MKYALMAVVLVVAAYFTWQQFKPAPPPAPEPAPAILIEPAPIISESEQARVIKSAKDQDPEVRWEAIVLLDKLKVPAALEVMFETLHRDMDVDLRLKLIRLLARRGAPKAEIAQNLVRAAKDPLPEIRVAALQALETLGDYSVASAVTDSLRDHDEKVRLQALKTLNSLQDQKTALIEAERKRQEELRRQAAPDAKGR